MSNNKKISSNFSSQKQQASEGSSPKPMNNENQKNKGHTKFRSKIHQGTEYLSSTIEPHPTDEYRFVCVECKTAFGRNYEGYCENLKGHLSNKQHSKTLKTMEDNYNVAVSIKHLDRGENQSPVLAQEDMIGIVSAINDQELGKSNDQTRFKFDLVCFLITNNLPFNLSQSLLSFLQHLYHIYDSDMINKATINDNQVTNIATNCIGEVLSQKMLSELTNSPYSIALDLGSDKSGKHYLSMNVRYFKNDGNNETQTKFLGLIEIGESSEGEILYQKVNRFLFSGPNTHKLKSNFLGICTDGAPNMISEKDKGLTNRLKIDHPHIIVIHDFAHVYSLVIKEAITKFPYGLIQVIEKITSHFSRSPQARAKFKSVQEKFGSQKKLEVLRYTKTRWFSLKDAVDRIIDLIGHFETISTCMVHLSKNSSYPIKMSFT